MITLRELLNTPIRIHNSSDRGSFEIKEKTPLIRCKDGFSMSVQTGETLYCTPRSNDGPWSSVEVGYPSQRVEALMPYIGDDDAPPTETVYGYVPIDIVERVIEAHGGICVELMALTADKPLLLR